MATKARERSDGLRFDVTVFLVSRRRPAVGANAAALPGPRDCCEENSLDFLCSSAQSVDDKLPQFGRRLCCCWHLHALLNTNI